MRIYRDERTKELTIQFDTAYNGGKGYWEDGIYISCTNINTIIFFNKEAEAKLRQGLEIIDKKEE